MVVATQNPIEQQGTYPLPEAQLDRFLFKQTLDYPDAEEERRSSPRTARAPAAADPAALGVGMAADRRREIAAAVAAVGDGAPGARGRRPMSSAWCAPRARPPDLETGASPAQRGDAGGRRPRPGGAGGPRLRHPRRRQGARPAGAAPPGDPVAGRRDRRAARPTRSIQGLIERVERARGDLSDRARRS